MQSEEESGMVWVRLDDSAAHHPKAATAGLEAWGFWVAGLCYCNRYMTDGVIEREALCDIAPRMTEDRALKLAAELVKAGHWIQSDGKFLVHDYAEGQPRAMKAAVMARRQKDKERQAERRRIENLADLSHRDNGVTPDGHRADAARTRARARPGQARPGKIKEEEVPVELRDMPTAEAVWRRLVAHPVLSLVANPTMAQELAAYEISLGRSPAQLERSVDQCAKKLRLEQAAGERMTPRQLIGMLLGFCKRKPEGFDADPDAAEAVRMLDENMPDLGPRRAREREQRRGRSHLPRERREAAVGGMAPVLDLAAYKPPESDE